MPIAHGSIAREVSNRLLSTLVSTSGPSQQTIWNILSPDMLHDWYGLLGWNRIGFIYIYPQINRLVLITSLSLDNLNLIFQTENRPASHTLSITRSIHCCVLNILLIFIVAIFSNRCSLLVLCVHIISHVSFWLATNIAKLLCSWVGFNLVVRGTGGVSLSAGFVQIHHIFSLLSLA